MHNFDPNTGFGMVMWILVIIAYFFPSIAVLNQRGHRHTTAVVLVNILAGWTVAGWVVAMGLAMSKPKAAPKRVITQQQRSLKQELQELKQLMDDGIITDTEFNSRKHRILNS